MYFSSGIAALFEKPLQDGLLRILVKYFLGVMGVPGIKLLFLPPGGEQNTI